MQRDDFRAFAGALIATLVLTWGLVYFVRHGWPLLPSWAALLVFIFLAVAVIGYPIYTLARWSDRYLARTRQGAGQSPQHGDKEKHGDKDN